MMQIDWSRLAEPQKDGYDVSVVVELAAKRAAEAGWTEEPWSLAGDFRIERLPEDMRNPKHYVEADPEGPGTTAVVDALRLWPVGFVSAAGCVDVYYPLRSPNWSGTGTGCVSGHNLPNRWRPRMQVYSTVNCPLGGAEGFVHEAGHCRLHLLGIGIEDHDGRLILNGDSSSEELYESPIRKDKPRPLCACVQAQYSYIWCVALDLVYHRAHEGDEEAQAKAVAYLRANVPRIEPAQGMIRENMRCTEAGEAFMGGLLAWGDRVIAEGRRIMDAAA